MNSDWLTQLAPEHTPAPPGWWPPAPGWWLVTGVCVALIAVGVWWWRYSRSVAQRRLRRTALRELQYIRERNDIVSVAQSIQNLLRRYALVTFGHDQVAHLSGDAWLKFVATQGGDLLHDQVGRALLSAAFGGAPALERREQWFAAAEAFIRAARPTHRGAQ